MPRKRPRCARRSTTHWHDPPGMKPPGYTLVYTPRSHFARKVRLLADALGIPLALVDAGNVADADPAAYGPNPRMMVPRRLVRGGVVFDADHIAACLVRARDPGARAGVLATDVAALNARAVMNGAMAQEVELLLAARSGLSTDHPR